MGGAVAIVLAGGSGTRVGAGGNKVYLRLGGRTVLGWSLRAFVGHPEIATVVLVVRTGDHGLAARELALLAAEDGARVRSTVEGRQAVPEVTYPGGQVRMAHLGPDDGSPDPGTPTAERDRTIVDGPARPTVVHLVQGGATRQGSELRGLRHVAADIRSGEIEAVLVHDAARPLVSAELISAVLAGARAWGGAVPGVLRQDIGAATAGGTGLHWPPAVGALVAVQTPQGFRAGPLLAAYEEADRQGFEGTDTASCVQRFTDLEVRWVPSDQRNLKITFAHDLVLAEHALRRR